MKFLLVNQFYVPDMAPTGRVLHDLAREMVQRGHDVDVLCSAGSYDGGRVYSSFEIIDGVKVSRLRASGFGRRSNALRLVDYISFYWLLFWRLIFFSSPQVVVALTTPPFAGFIVKTVSMIRRWRHVHWVMDIYPDVMIAHGMLQAGSLKDRCLRLLARIQFKGSSGVITLGPDMAQRLARYVKDRDIEWIPLWANDELEPLSGTEIIKERKIQGWSDNELVLMYSGNMGFGHRIHEFLEASLKTGSDVRFVFCGGGRRRREVEEFIRLHPQAKVELHPYIRAEGLKRRIGAADVLLASLDAKWQGCMLPVKAQSAFAVGVPLLFVGGENNSIAGWIQGSGAGRVVAEDDIDELVSAISELRSDKERSRCVGAAIEFSKKHFCRHTNCVRICELIEAASNYGLD